MRKYIEDNNSNHFALNSEGEVTTIREINECECDGCEAEATQRSIIDNSWICGVCAEIEIDNLSDDEYQAMLS